MIFTGPVPVNGEVAMSTQIPCETLMLNEGKAGELLLVKLAPPPPEKFVPKNRVYFFGVVILSIAAVSVLLIVWRIRRKASVIVA